MPIEVRPPPPRPWTTRPKISTSRLGASAQISEPTMWIMSAAMTVRRRPWMSLILP
jgi:hypothetical protein